MPHFVTSRQEDDHVTSANTAHLTAGLLGNGCYVLPIGQKLACTMTDSNTLRVLFGVASVCGRQWEIEGDYEEVNIDNGVPGYNRTDLLVCRIETAPQETIELKVYKGDETTGTPVVPGHVEGDLNDGDTVCEMPICSVRVNGINPQAPEMLTKESIDIMALLQELRDYKSQSIDGDKLVDKSVATAKIEDEAVTSAKLSDTAVSDKMVITYVAEVTGVGTFYVIGGRIGILQVNHLCRTAITAWGKVVEAVLPKDMKSSRAATAALVCEDHEERIAVAVVNGSKVEIQNRSSSAWAVGSTGFYMKGQVVFPVA